MQHIIYKFPNTYRIKLNDRGTFHFQSVTHTFRQEKTCDLNCDYFIILGTAMNNLIDSSYEYHQHVGLDPRNNNFVVM